MPAALLTAPAPAVTSDPVFAAIEAHREALSVLSAEVHYALKKSRARWCAREKFREASDAYEAATSAFVEAPISSLAGLRAFTAYVAGLKAYGPVGGNPGCYAIEVWHLSDVVSSISEAMGRLLPSDAATFAH